jgi:hypothetical protein
MKLPSPQDRTCRWCGDRVAVQLAASAHLRFWHEAAVVECPLYVSLEADSPVEVLDADMDVHAFHGCTPLRKRAPLRVSIARPCQQRPARRYRVRLCSNSQ